MKLIESKVEVIEQLPGLDGVYKQIELAGRTCYKSEDKITEDSAKAFVDRMIGSKHGAMLEHGTVYLLIRDCDETDTHINEYMSNPYTKVNSVGNWWYVTTNLRVLVENDWMHDLLLYLSEPTEHHEKRITTRFTCDRGVSHEIVRHRVMSFAQESTRYCNYSKDKFGNELTFIKPTWYNQERLEAEIASTIEVDTEEIAEQDFNQFLNYCQRQYFKLLNKGCKPQEARQVLPNAVKTEIIVTGFESDWEHFFSLRSPKYGAQGVHPDMAKLADELYEKLNSVNK